jgi:hypothetical protein
MRRRRDITVSLPQGQDAVRAQQVLRADLLAVIAGIDGRDSLAVSLAKVLRAIACAVLP